MYRDTVLFTISLGPTPAWAASSEQLEKIKYREKKKGGMQRKQGSERGGGGEKRAGEVALKDNRREGG